MSILKNLFGKKETTVTTYQDFWDWFQKNEKHFFSVVKNHKSVEREFFQKLSPKLDGLKEGFFYLTGMYDDDTVELVLTPDGNIRNIVFVEELVNAAPKLPGWKFTALKPALDIKDVSIEMAGYTFSHENICFYATEHPGLPDEIDLTIVHDDLNEENRQAISNGTYIFLDNYLGELNFATTIDNLQIIGKAEAQEECIPIEKLKPFLIWREKEFIEKYEGSRHNTENDTYSSFQAELENGKPMVAIVNAALLEWDGKASHPWILSIEFHYDGTDNNGLPDADTYKLLDLIEDKIMTELKDSEGYLNIGRQTADGIRETYFACNDFRKPSKVVYSIIEEYADRLEITFDLYKDKYWQSFNRFRVN